MTIQETGKDYGDEAYPGLSMAEFLRWMRTRGEQGDDTFLVGGDQPGEYADDEQITKQEDNS